MKFDVKKAIYMATFGVTGLIVNKQIQKFNQIKYEDQVRQMKLNARANQIYQIKKAREEAIRQNRPYLVDMEYKMLQEVMARES